MSDTIMSDTLDMIPGRSPEVTISKEEYYQLQAYSNLLNALLSVGVDNWEGWDSAHEVLDLDTRVDNVCNYGE